jgi:hypothetical protein
MKWKQPHHIKIYEALGVVADERIEVTDTSAKVFSSSRNKFYTVEFDPENHAIMANDNASYWNGTLGYPAIAYLLKKRILEYKPNLANLLKGIAWKDLNQKYKNNFEKTIDHIRESMKESEREELSAYVEQLSENIVKLDLNLLGKKKLPPQGY